MKRRANNKVIIKVLVNYIVKIYLKKVGFLLYTAFSCLGILIFQLSNSTHNRHGENPTRLLQMFIESSRF